MLDAALRMDDAFGLDEYGTAMGDGGGREPVVEAEDSVLGMKGATQVEGDEGSNRAEASDVDAHRRRSRPALARCPCPISCPPKRRR